MSIATYGGSPVALALATDLLQPGRIGRGLAVFNAASWGAGALGFAATGALLEQWGAAIVFPGTAVFAGLAAVLVLVTGMRTDLRTRWTKFPWCPRWQALRAPVSWSYQVKRREAR